MTDQEKISRLADAGAMDILSSSRDCPDPRTARSFVSRKMLLRSDRHAFSDPLPFFPRVAFHQEARVLISDRHSGLHNRRMRQAQPSLAAASCCLLFSLSALYVTSPHGEESLAGVAHAVHDRGDAGVMLIGSAP